MRLFLLGLLIILTSCENKDKPMYTLTEAELFQVFKDVKIAENALSKQMKSERDSLRDVYSKQISEIHKIPYSTIEDNLIELQKDLVLQKRFYEELRDTLSQYQDKYDQDN